MIQPRKVSLFLLNELLTLGCVSQKDLGNSNRRSHSYLDPPYTTNWFIELGLRRVVCFSRLTRLCFRMVALSSPLRMHCYQCANARALHPTHVAAPKRVPALRPGLVIRNLMWRIT